MLLLSLSEVHSDIPVARLGSFLVSESGFVANPGALRSWLSLLPEAVSPL